MSRTMLLCAVAVAATVMAGFGDSFAEEHDHDHTMVLSVEGMCCGKEAKAAVKKLKKVKRVKAVVADIDAGTLTITPKGKKEPSPKAIWEAAEAAGVTPIELVTAHETFTEKPSE